MLGLILHFSGGGGAAIDISIIYSYFQSTIKNLHYCFILTNKFIKLTKMKNILFIISAQERLGVYKQKGIYRYGPRGVEKYPHRQNLISCITKKNTQNIMFYNLASQEPQSEIQKWS